MTGPAENQTPAELFDLHGSVAIVTGSGRGIGEGIAKVLASAGAAVVCAARRTEEIEQVAADIIKAGGQALAVTTDVTDPAALEALAQAAIKRFGAINIWVNNAGGSPLQAPLSELSREDWDNTIALNLTAVFVASQVAVKHMAQGGCIVNTSSVAAEEVVVGSGHYSAAKAGVNMLTKALACEVGPDIRVNAVLPGFVPTEVVRKALNISENEFGELERSLKLPMVRLGTPFDLGAAVLYLCSPASAWVTGQCLRISGGP